MGSTGEKKGSTGGGDEVTSGKYVILFKDQPRELTLRSWRPQEKFKDDQTGQLKPGVTFNVVEENGREVEKEFTVTSKRLLLQLRPICERAESEGKVEIRVMITRTGDGRDTAYTVSVIPDVIEG